MTDQEVKDRIQAGRRFMGKWSEEKDKDFVSDQQKLLPQPPLTKAPMAGPERQTALPRDFENLELKNGVLELFRNRKSSRVYTEETMSLLELSFLLWATQGVKGIRGKSYATLRTVPCGGARHEFECYFLAQNVEGLSDGAYHYLPMEHAVELLRTREELEAEFSCDYRELISSTMNRQAWTAKGNINFYYSMVAYRAEWRYGIRAHRVALIDAGHITENLYLACCAAGLGTCAIGALDTALCNRLFQLDGDEEFAFYAASVGTISEKDKEKEQEFYAFVKRDNL